mgnify:CR=1 FL=1
MSKHDEKAEAKKHPELRRLEALVKCAEQSGNKERVKAAKAAVAAFGKDAREVG